VARLNISNRNHNFPFRIPSQTPGASLETLVGLDRHFAFAHVRQSQGGYAVVPSGSEIANLYRLRSPGPGHFWQGSVPQVPAPQSTYDNELSAVLAETDALVESTDVPTSPPMADKLGVWLDLQDADSYEVTEGTPDVVQRITNKASGVEWVETTNPPEFESAGMNGLPCLKGDGVERRIQVDDDELAAEVFTGLNPAFSVYAVIHTDDDEQVWMEAYGETGGVYDSFEFWGGDTEIGHVLIEGGTTGAVFAEMPVGVPDEPTIAMWLRHSATIDAALGAAKPLVLEGAPFAKDAPVGISSIALFSAAARPEILFYSGGRIGELLIYSGGHRLYQRRLVQRYLAAKWGIE
jgi:hypothetical protein